MSVPQIRVRSRFFSYFSTQKYAVCTQNNRLDDTVLLSTQIACFKLMKTIATSRLYCLTGHSSCIRLDSLLILTHKLHCTSKTDVLE